MSTIVRDDTFKLTAFARCAGCAAKLGAGELTRALSSVPVFENHVVPRVVKVEDEFAKVCRPVQLFA